MIIDLGDIILVLLWYLFGGNLFVNFGWKKLVLMMVVILFCLEYGSVFVICCDWVLGYY